MGPMKPRVFSDQFRADHSPLSARSSTSQKKAFFEQENPCYFSHKQFFSKCGIFNGCEMLNFKKFNLYFHRRKPNWSLK